MSQKHTNFKSKLDSVNLITTKAHQEPSSWKWESKVHWLGLSLQQIDETQRQEIASTLGENHLLLALDDVISKENFSTKQYAQNLEKPTSCGIDDQLFVHNLEGVAIQVKRACQGKQTIVIKTGDNKHYLVEKVQPYRTDLKKARKNQRKSISTDVYIKQERSEEQLDEVSMPRIESLQLSALYPSSESISFNFETIDEVYSREKESQKETSSQRCEERQTLLNSGMLFF